MSGSLVPFRQFVLKIHSRCDLACDHCYVYQHADQSWRSQPTVMSDETIAKSAKRIAEHAKAHSLSEVHIILHGGEPLLAGHARLGRIARMLHDALGGICALDLRVHTNGVLLDDAFCELFAAHDVQVGISLDGYRTANDRHRRYADGRSSYDQVMSAIRLLRRAPYRRLYAGLLCTIDIANNPIAVYESLMALEPPRIDFLLPHATWDVPPQRPAGAETAYGDWLAAIFDRWIADGRPAQIRLFQSIVQTTYGGDSLTEAIGLQPSDLVVIETDGTYEQADSLKTAFDGAPATGFDVMVQPLDVVASHPGVTARQQGLAGLCHVCRTCPVVTSCGGGLYAHRYRSGSGFSNPSVYCQDLLKLITHVRGRCFPAPHGGGDIPGHAIPSVDLEALAAGFGGAAAIDRLTQAQQTVQRALIASVHESAIAAGFREVRPAWDVLTQIDMDHPQELSAVLGHPFVRVWAARCMERLRAGVGNDTSAAIPLSIELGHIASIAIASAIRSGVHAQLSVPVRNGAIYLPTLGQLIVGDRQSANVAVIEVAPGTVTVRAETGHWTIRLHPSSAVRTRVESAAMRGWQPVRTLTASAMSVMLEDTDPYRDCHQWVSAPRLARGDVADWRCRFEDAWDLICKEHKAYAPGLAVGLRSVVPLSPAPAGHGFSATARHAFGAIAAALPPDAATLALLLIHEFQHVKLGAVLDLFELFDRTDTRLFDAPWRRDPRPLEGLLQGTYAHVAVTDFWRMRRHTADTAAATAAAAQFAYWRAQTAQAIETLAASHSLTPLGARFVDGMRASVSSWLEEPLHGTKTDTVPPDTSGG
jgi:uncharacterized protein